MSTVVDPPLFGEFPGRAVTTELLCAYSRLNLGSSNADALELPDNKVAQLVVARTATTGFAVRYPM